MTIHDLLSVVDPQTTSIALVCKDTEPFFRGQIITYWNTLVDFGNYKLTDSLSHLEIKEVTTSIYQDTINVVIDMWGYLKIINSYQPMEEDR